MVVALNTSSTVEPVNMYDSLNSFILSPGILIIIFLIIVAYFILFSSLGNNEDNSDNKSGNIMGIIIVVILVILIIINAFQYFFDINVTAYFKDIFTPHKQIDIVVDQSAYHPITIPLIQKQVFNIPGNYYNYENAKAICNAYNSDLATYQQVENAYKNGGEWCNYGWSDGQMALFPTQQTTFNKLQNIKGHEHDCGRPGVNGGYIANPQVKFGVNCYGNKPRMTEEEEDLMKVSTPYVETNEEINFQKRVNFWKNRVDDILVSPFNYNTWRQ
jgi:heme/copper-type cytochrome/quinol oxidase subunit 2